MEAIKELEDIVAKTAKKTSNENRKKAVEALEVMFAETNDPKQVTEYLIKLHYSVCQAFLEEFCSSASDGSISAIVEALVSNEQFMKGNPNNIMYPKGLSAVLALASKEKYQSAFLVLLRILSQSEKSNGFSDGCVNNFKKLVVDKGGLPHILALFEQVSNGAVVCKEYEQRRFARFLKTVDNKTVVTTKEEVSTSAKKSELTKQPSSESDQLGNIDSAPEPKLTTKYDSAETVSKIEKTQQEILTAIRRLADNRSSIDSLTVTLARRDDELNSLRTTVSEKEHRVLSLVSELAVKDKQFLEAKGQIDELTQRLRASLQMDDISKSQELITLKNDISEALKLDYADYAKSKDSPYSDDLFEAYRSTLTRIFKLLKRFGITCQ